MRDDRCHLIEVELRLLEVYRAGYVFYWRVQRSLGKMPGNT